MLCKCDYQSPKLDKVLIYICYLQSTRYHSFLQGLPVVNCVYGEEQPDILALQKETKGSERDPEYPEIMENVWIL